MSCAKNCSTKPPGSRNVRRQLEFTEEGGPQTTKFDSPNFNRYEDFKRIARSQAQSSFIEKPKSFETDAYDFDQSSSRDTRRTSEFMSGVSPLDSTSFRSSYGRRRPSEEIDTSGGPCSFPGRSEVSGYYSDAQQQRQRDSSFCGTQASSGSYSRSRQGSRSPTRASFTCPGTPQANSTAISPHSGYRSPTRHSGDYTTSIDHTTTEYGQYPELPSDSSFAYTGPRLFSSTMPSLGSRTQPPSGMECPGSPLSLTTSRGPQTTQRSPPTASSYVCPGSARPSPPRPPCGTRSSSPGPPRYQTTRKRVTQDIPGKRYTKVTEFKTLPLDTTSSMEVSVPQSCSEGLDRTSYSNATNFTTYPADDSFVTLPGSYGGSFKTLPKESVSETCGGTFKTLPLDSSQLSMVSEEGSECSRQATQRESPRSSGRCLNKTYTKRGDKSHSPSRTTRNKTIKHTPEGEVITEEIEEVYDRSSSTSKEKKHHKKGKEHSSKSKCKCMKKKGISRDSSETVTEHDKKCSCAGNICLISPQYCMIPQMIPHMAPAQMPCQPVFECFTIPRQCISPSFLASEKICNCSSS